jgi:DNA-binding FadR family transcriptional regulator
VLPNEASLCEKLGVSRTALREGMKVLSAKGLVEVRRKTGTRIRPMSNWNMLDPEVLSWMFSAGGAPFGLEHLIEIRRVVEPVAARMAAKRATDEELAEIARAFESMNSAKSRLSSSIAPDLRFHLAIFSATHNIFMRSFGTLIQSALRASFRLTSTDNAAYKRTLTLHGEILRAIQAKNSTRAERAMLALLNQTSSELQEKMGRPSSKKEVQRKKADR